MLIESENKNRAIPITILIPSSNILDEFRNSFNSSGWVFNSAVYFTSPFRAPRDDILVSIEEKSLNIPTNANPDGPIKKANALEEIMPAIILITSDTELKAPSFNNPLFLILSIAFFSTLIIYSINNF